jgi:hypothetical protein
MSEFGAYLQLGFEHITDPNGFDHILFIVALCTIFQLKDWKKVLILVTAFTIGHSITLALATLNLFSYRTDIIEFLIPVTILVTAIANLFHRSRTSFTGMPREKPQYARYFFALSFGLIHGLGFSTYLRSLLGQENSLFRPLLAFNVGLELGQLAIVLVFLAIATLISSLLRVAKHDWNLITSGLVAGMALMLIINNDIFRSIL